MRSVKQAIMAVMALDGILAVLTLYVAAGAHASTGGALGMACALLLCAARTEYLR